MATGPQHYQDAERLLAAARTEEQHALGGNPDVVANMLRAAEVHARLAEVAVTAATSVTTHDIGDDGSTASVTTVDGWDEVLR